MNATVVSANFLLMDQRARWKQGDRVRVETYLDEYPQLRADTDAVLQLIWNEALLREERGDRPRLAEYLPRFNAYQVQLTELFQAQRTQRVEGDPAPHTRLPDAPGQEKFPTIPGYEILSELGLGADG